MLGTAASLQQQVEALLAVMPADSKAELERTYRRTKAAKPFTANEGVQTQAYHCQADVLFYGGQAGGGKTLLELGWAVNEAESGIIFRRERTQTDGLEKEGKKLIGSAASFNGQDLEWTWPSGKSLKLAGMKEVDSWMGHAGRERDYMAFDEGGEFLEIQIASIMGWLRAAPGKRCRVIIGSNPPRSSDGEWVLKWFAPWLDPHFHPKAMPGELRWAVYVTTNGRSEMKWVEGPGEYEIDGETYLAKSYCFIPASLRDNPYRDTPEYRAQLQNMPGNLRAQLLYGDFAVGVTDAEGQIIPTAWIKAAQARWSPNPPAGVPMCAMGVDCSGGGDDPMVIAPRYDGWYPDPVVVPGKDIPKDRLGTYAAGIVVSHRRNEARVIVDMGGGYGGPVYEHLHAVPIEVEAYKGAVTSSARTKDRQLTFFNKRTEALWRFREALNPDQDGGSLIALPPDPEITSDLTAPTHEVVNYRGALCIKAESKDDVCAKLGRSTNKGDAIIMAWTGGLKQANVKDGWAGYQKRRTNQVILGHMEARRRR